MEIWLEKEALSGVLSAVTGIYDVPLMVTRGYPSLTYLYEAAGVLNGVAKAVHLYYFGDYDPSGVDISRKVEERLRRFAPEVELHFTRVAVNQEQIERLHLPTRPTKPTDSRSGKFTGESVEVDAIDPNTLRSMVEEVIAKHIDVEELARLEEVEEAERGTLARIAEMLKRDLPGDPKCQ